MKRQLTLIVLTLLFSGTVFGQSMQDEIELMQSIFGMEKKALVAEFIKLDDAKSVTFWDLYDKYEVERKALGQNRIALLMDYAEHYDALDDGKTDELMKNIITQRKNIDNLIDKYYKQLKKKVGSLEAAQFYQIEGYILSMIRVDILENIPFFGEFDD